MALAALPLSSAQDLTVNGTSVIVRQEDTPILGIFNREMLILIILIILAGYILTRVWSMMRAKQREKEEAGLAEEMKVTQLKREREKMKLLMEEAKKSYYKRELSEEGAKELLFDYKQRLMEVEAELKKLGELPAVPKQ